jgi:UDP-N-acetyl-D-glucosamine/UDP-N-acetyl-D-galactosamine dehydrogenase
LNKPTSITIVGLGYVGLPLTIAFAKEFPTTGFDIEKIRVDQLLDGIDRNREVPEAEIQASDATFTVDATSIIDADFIIVTVPTPVTEDHKPDLSLLKSASEMIGTQLRARPEHAATPIVVFESTTYPGCTENYCGPIIERESGLKSGEGFYLGYSPERTNFGDAEHTLETVIKVLAGQTPEVTQAISDVYKKIAKAGTHLAADIKTAEASKVIENVQRDLNIALFNELAIIFDRMGINSSDVFDAAATKWNFQRYFPGLVGGHCIPVDPYYLTHAAAEMGYEANVVLAGRAANEMMPEYIASKAVDLVRERGGKPESSSVLVLGATFKNDVVDIRNSKAITLAEELVSQFDRVDVYDPQANEITGVGFEPIGNPFGSGTTYTVVVFAVAHREFGELVNRVHEIVAHDGVVIDAVGLFESGQAGDLGATVWSL